MSWLFIISFFIKHSKKVLIYLIIFQTYRDLRLLYEDVPLMDEICKTHTQNKDIQSTENTL